MDIGGPFKELGAVEAAALAEAVRNLHDEAWNTFDYRQKADEMNNLKFHEVHNEGAQNRHHLIFDYVPPQ
jgi:hypothetical protein